MSRATLTIATAVLLTALVATPTAQATYDPLGSGQTAIVLDKRFASYLAKEKIKLSAKAGAKRKGRKLTLPVNAGNVDPTQGAGEVGAGGTLLFRSGNRKVPLRSIRARIKRDTLIANAQPALATIAPGPRSSSIPPFRRRWTRSSSRSARSSPPNTPVPSPSR